MRMLIRVAAALVLASAVAAPASAQGFTVNLGYFALKGSEARVAGDTLNANLGVDPDTINALPLFFETKDFNGALINGEFFVPIGDFLEAAAGLGFYQKTVPSVYETVTFGSGAEIAQDLKLRIVPITATVKVLPFGRDTIVQPYFGAGVGIFRWRYSEIGDFVDSFDGTIFSNRYVGEGTSAGPVVLVGARFPITDRFLTGGEARWQKAEGDLPSDVDFLGTKIDLGGWTFAWTLSFK